MCHLFLCIDDQRSAGWTHHCLFIPHVLMPIWAVFSLGILQSSCYEHVCTSLYEHMLSFLVVKDLGVEWLYHV